MKGVGLAGPSYLSLQNINRKAESKAAEVGTRQVSAIFWFLSAEFLNLVGERKQCMYIHTRYSVWLTVVPGVPCCIHFSPQTHEGGNVIAPILQMKSLLFRRSK